MDEGLRAAVDGGVGEDAPARDAADVDDVPAARRAVDLSGHVGQARAGAVEDAVDVDIDRLGPVVLAQRLDRAEWHDACVVDEDVDGPEGRDGFVHHRADAGALGDVALDGEGAPGGPVGGDLVLEAAEPIGAPPDEHDAHALRGEESGGGFSDAAGRAGTTATLVARTLSCASPSARQSAAATLGRSRRRVSCE